MSERGFSEKTADYTWRDKLWELKEPSSVKAADDRIRSGLKQIRNNSGGIILDFHGNEIDMQMLIDVINNRARRSSIKAFDVMIVQRNRVIAIFRYKK